MSEGWQALFEVVFIGGLSALAYVMCGIVVAKRFAPPIAQKVASARPEDVKFLAFFFWPLLLGAWLAVKFVYGLVDLMCMTFKVMVAAATSEPVRAESEPQKIMKPPKAKPRELTTEERLAARLKQRDELLREIRQLQQKLAEEKRSFGPHRVRGDIGLPN